MPRLSLAALAALIVLALSATAASASPHPRIINGEDADAPQPYQVALWTAGEDRDVYCGGTLVNEDTVVTAAHCVEGTEPEEILVTAGLLNQYSADDDGQDAVTVGVEGIRIAVDYSPDTLYGDVAVLRLDQDIPDDDASGIHHLPLAASGDYAGDDAIVSGWGNRSVDDEDYPDTLQRAILPVRPDSDCDALDNWTDLEDSMVCAGGDEVDPPRTDTCQGDSGGPLALRDTGFTASALLGIVSFGTGCGDDPGAYTDVTSEPANTVITDDSLGFRPDNLTAPTLGGTAQVGKSLVCNPGTWTGSPSFTYSWFVGTGDEASELEWDARTLPLDATDRGLVYSCGVRADNDGGWNVLYSNEATVRAAPPKPNPKPNPKPGPDVTAPTASFAKRKCSKKRRCTLTLRVADDRGLGGVSAVAKIKRLSGCKKGRKGRKCRKARVLAAGQTTPGVFTFKTKKLKPAKYRVTFAVRDAAGNTSTIRVTFRVKRKRK